MRRERPPIAIHERVTALANATHWSKKHFDDYIQTALEAGGDLDKPERLRCQRCITCFYLRRGRVAGAAITTTTCRYCFLDMSFPTTNVDELCHACAKGADLCAQCGGQMEFKK